MGKTRQLVLTGEGGVSAKLGTADDVLKALAGFNTAPDGSTETSSVAYGPGFRVELPMAGDSAPVAQALATITDEDCAWPVLFRLTTELGWRMLDPETGREFGG